MSKLPDKTPAKGKIIPRGVDTLADFYDLEAFGTATKASRFDVDEEVQATIKHIRDPDPKVSLAGLRHFRTVMKDLLRTNGLIGTATQIHTSQNADGSTVQRAVETQTLLTRLRKENTNAQDNKEIEVPHDIYLPPGQKEEGQEADSTEDPAPKTNRAGRFATGASSRGKERKNSNGVVHPDDVGPGGGDSGAGPGDH